MNQFVFKLPKRKKFKFLSSQQFKIIRKIGSGGFAKVYLVKCIVDDQLYAMKKIEFSRISNLDQENVQKEIKIHKKLKSEYIVDMIDYFQEDRVVYIILEYCKNGDLYEFMKKRSRIPSDMILSFFRDICNGIKYLHDNQIIMRDLKPENCLLTHDNRIKICDFGWACKFNDEEHYLKLQAGSLPYMSPESLRGDTSTQKTDIWSLGILLYELFFNKEPFLANSPETQLILIENSVVDFNPGFIIESAKDLIESTLQLRERDRPTIDQLLRSDYLNNINQNYYSDFKKKQIYKNQRDYSTPVVKKYVLEHSSSQTPRKKSSEKKQQLFITNDTQKFIQEQLVDKKILQQNNPNQQQKYYQIKRKKSHKNCDENQNDLRSKSVNKIYNTQQNYKQESNLSSIQKNILNNFKSQEKSNEQFLQQNNQVDMLVNTTSKHKEYSNELKYYQKQKSLVIENSNQNNIQIKKTRTSYVDFQKHSKSQNFNEPRRLSIIRIDDLKTDQKIADQIVDLLKTEQNQIRQKIPKYSVPYQKSAQHPVLQNIYKNQKIQNKASQNQFIVHKETSDRQIKLYNEKKNVITSKKIRNDKVLGYQQLMQSRNQLKNKMILPVTNKKQPKFKREKQIVAKVYKPSKPTIRSKSAQIQKNSALFYNYNFNKNINGIFNISGRQFEQSNQFKDNQIIMQLTRLTKIYVCITIVLNVLSYLEIIDLPQQQENLFFLISFVLQFFQVDQVSGFNKIFRFIVKLSKKRSYNASIRKQKFPKKYCRFSLLFISSFAVLISTRQLFLQQQISSLIVSQRIDIHICKNQFERQHDGKSTCISSFSRFVSQQEQFWVFQNLLLISKFYSRILFTIFLYTFTTS